MACYYIIPTEHELKSRVFVIQRLGFNSTLIVEPPSNLSNNTPPLAFMYYTSIGSGSTLCTFSKYKRKETLLTIEKQQQK